MIGIHPSKKFIDVIGRSTLRLLAILAAAVAYDAAPGRAQSDSDLAISSDQAAKADRVELLADRLQYDSDAGIVTASGRVVLLYRGYRLNARTVIYNEQTGDVRAEGGVVIVDPEGNLLTAGEAELNETLSEGFITGVELVLTDGSRVAANRAERTGERRTILERAVYSPCKICEQDPENPPLWQIKAVKVIHDQDKKRLYYEDAYLEVAGVPIAYLPFLSHPDPSVDRASGFLPVEVRQRQELGVVLAAPYYQVFTPQSDLTVTPQVATGAAPVLGGQYRQHLGFGRFNLEGSVTYTGRRNEEGERIPGDEFRGHVFSGGRFLHGNNWRSTYRAQWASDDTYLRLYDFTDADTLSSEYLLEGFFGRSYVSARTLAFQGLRVEDIAGLTPFALPLIDAEYVSDPNQYLGGTLRLRGNALALNRSSGLDSRRLSASATWQRRQVTPLGQVIELAGHLRADLYDVSDADEPDSPVFGGAGGSDARLLPRASITVTWPFARYARSGRQVIEPIVQVVASPADSTPDAIPNEDSRTFELNDINLFDPDRTPGFDIWESGTRVTYGLRHRWRKGDFSTEFLLGQSHRFEERPDLFPPGTGLGDDFSDIVGRLNLTFSDWADINYRFQLDTGNGTFRRQEIYSVFGPRRLRLEVGYLKLDRDLTIPDRGDREEVRLSGRLRITDQWTLIGNYIDDFSEDSDPIEYAIGLMFENECLEFGLTVRERFTRDRDIEPGTSILFRIKLRNLG